MHTINNIYPKIYSLSNLVLAWKKARRHKTKKDYVIEFEKNLINNLLKLQEELINLTYTPRKLKSFILRDPKTRKISKSDFRDRIIHHALCNIIEPIYEKIFIYDSCASRKGKGNLFALKRFYYFIRKISRNGKPNGWFNNNQVNGYCLKCDIKHYFNEVDHNILMKIISKRIIDKNVLWLIRKIINNIPNGGRPENGMPLGNLTSQFFANVYLNELDYFIKHKLKVKYYLRYVDDFVILDKSRNKLKFWKNEINKFLNNELKLQLHSQKSKIIPLSKGIDFVGFRNFFYFKLLRKRNIRKMLLKIEKYKNNEINKDKIIESFQGWNAYAKWANSYNLRKNIESNI
ncbi:MAG: reverse transcriptase domain-containing protein [Nanoarchaeota archaeon]